MVARAKRIYVAAVAVFFSASCLPHEARAWGDEGHMAVGLIAEQFLTPVAKSKVDALLESDRDRLTATDIASRATWADRYRDSDRHTTMIRYLATRQWHFVDIEVDAPNQDQACFGHPPIPTGKSAIEGPADDCVVDKINQFWAELKDPATSPPERLLAFKFLLHFVGDVHQPLHSSDHNDKGGNDTLVVYGRRRVGSPLHGYWDSTAVKNINNDEQELAAALVERFGNRKSEWMSGRAKDWATESFEKGRTIAYNLPSRRVRDSNNVLVYHLDREYEDDARDTAAEQLAKAGMRLALVLNDALDPH